MKFIYLTLYYAGDRILLNLADVRLFKRLEDQDRPGEYKTRVVFHDENYIEVMEQLGHIGEQT